MQALIKWENAGSAEWPWLASGVNWRPHCNQNVATKQLRFMHCRIGTTKDGICRRNLNLTVVTLWTDWVDLSTT